MVTYSQGGVVAWDLIRRIAEFDGHLQLLLNEVGKEWKEFESGAEFAALNDAIINFFLIYNIRIQAPETFERSVDAQNIYFRAEKNMKNAINRFKEYIRFDSGRSRFPKIQKWLQKNYIPPEDLKDLNRVLATDFFMQYAAYRNILPLRIRVFSITGSFFGSPEANRGYFFVKWFPWLSKPIIGDRAGQIRDTRVGSRHHLRWTKQIFNRIDQHGQYLEGVYFILGVSGIFATKGDGLVDQPSAHVSKHLFTDVPLEALLEKDESEISQKGSLKFEWRRLNDQPLTGLEIRHMPRKYLLFPRPGAAQMNEKSKVYPFLIAYLKRDEEELERLHEKEGQALKQFMISVFLPENGELRRSDFNVKEDTKEIKITHRIDNSSSNAITWTGIFKSAKFKRASVDLNYGGRFGKKRKININVHPGAIHFVDIVASEPE